MLLESVAEESKYTLNPPKSMLIWSMKDEGKIVLNIQNVFLTSEGSEVIKEFKSQYKRKNLNIINNIPENNVIQAVANFLK